MKIAFVGPVAPFRSGVAKHSTAFALALQAGGAEVQVFSFSRQYPRLLFPGEDQYDSGLAAADDLPTQFCIDTIWPPSWSAAACKIIDFAPDAVVIACWTFFTAPALAQIARQLRASGIRVIAMVHNPSDHEASGWKQALLSRQIRAADAAIAHSGPVRASVTQIAPQLPVITYPHPLYDTHPAPQNQLPRRAAKELLFFGLIRPYKGLDILLDALDELEPDFFLTIAGEVWGEKSALETRIAASRHAARIELLADYISDQHAADLFARCDLLVAPYRSATGSGVIALAHHYRKPVIASDIAVMRETIADQQTGWLFPAGNAAALAAILAQDDLCDRARLMDGAIGQLGESRSWNGLARLTIALSANNQPTQL